MLDKLHSKNPQKSLRAAILAAAAAITLTVSHTQGAHAETSLLAPGDSVVTGFSGIDPSNSPAATDSNPLQGYFIDLDGPSAQILSLRALGSAPQGALSDAEAKHRITAREIGQVFAIAFDDGGDQSVPYIYFGSTSYFGLEIVIPDNNGDGKPERVKIGQPDAQWMPGQFGANGNPGTVWRVNGKTGEVSLFASLPDNSGPGIGDIVFDETSRQFFVSDLDTGLIYRISQDGTVIGTFDHGVDGRSAAGLTPIEDDGEVADITSSAFNGADPATWGYTQKHRRIAGMALRDGRLYYAVAGAQQVWSVAIAEDGSLSDDAQIEFDVENLPGAGPVTDMAFDKSGRLYLAQRGEQRASDDYSSFAATGKSAVVRYRRATDSETGPAWVQDGQDYAIGTAPGHHQSNGGIALGYAHDETGDLRADQPDATLWTTGDRLLASDPATDETAADVHGLQGNDVSLTRPSNVPPAQSYFIDYDGLLGDYEKTGHMGDVEIWQSDDDAVASVEAETPMPPGYEVPAATPPPGVPTEFVPHDPPFTTNLKLIKQAVYKTCQAVAAGWKCKFRIKVKNTGPDTYAGPIRISDRLVNPAGTTLGFSTSPNWTCWTVGAADYRCRRFAVLPKGASISLTATALVPFSFKRCRLMNVATIIRAPGGSRWNTNPADDRDTAIVKVPTGQCEPAPEKPTNLSLSKKVLSCGAPQSSIGCSYQITVTNTGSNTYNAPLVIRDLPQAGATSVQFQQSKFNCTPVGGGAYECKYKDSPANLAPGASVSFLTWMHVSRQTARNNQCKVTNRAWIKSAPGGSVQNTDASDDGATATATIPDEMCNPGRPDIEKDPQPLNSNLKIEKRMLRLDTNERTGKWVVSWSIVVTNTGPGNFNDVISFNEMFPAGTTLVAWSADLTCSGSQCVSDGPVALNAVGASKSYIVHLSGTSAVARRLNCRVTNKVTLISPAGFPINNTDRSDDTASASTTLPAEFCKPLTSTPAPGPETGDIKSPPVVNCLPHHTLVKGRCLPRVVHCPSGLKKVTASRIRTLRNNGWTIGKVSQHGKTIWCGKPGHETAPKCPRPAQWNGKKCACPGHKVWNGKRCVEQKATAPKKCKRGHVGHPPNCRKASSSKPNDHRARTRRGRK